jgi:soluble lytic murein transglycosylase
MRASRLADRFYAATLPALMALALLAGALPCFAQSRGDEAVLDARDALRKRDRARLAVDRAVVVAERHPLASWVEYWELGNRLSEVNRDEVEAFYTRWNGSYVEDRLRNDWLLELGHRRDWDAFKQDFPRFRMNDDREVTCYWLLTQHYDGREVRDAARAAWMAQRDTDEGCTLLASTLVDAKVFDNADAWRVTRLAAEFGRPRVAKFAAGLISPAAGAAAVELFDNPARYLARKATTGTRPSAELTAMALMRMAANDPEATAGQLSERWERALPADLAARTWAVVGKQAAMKLSPEAMTYSQRAWALLKARGLPAGTAPDWSDDTLAWQVRAALRADGNPSRWPFVLQVIDAMSEAERRDPAWVYWKARALQATAGDDANGAAQRAAAGSLLGSIAGQMHFYGKLAAEDLGWPITLPPKPEPLTEVERSDALSRQGLARAVQLIALGLRNEGVREWNYSLRGMGDRELLAAAQLACERELWDRCINTSDRTREQIDMDQRFPTPFRNEVVARAQDVGIDPAYVYGLIRQESRFVLDARSSVGASGLMQIMPSTARWTAKKLGLDISPEMLTERDTNIRLGTAYLKLVLDSFEGSQAMAAAAYNAGPNRSRRWRDGPVLDAAIWAENIPFSETRDYVKKVLSNATYYAALLTGQQPLSLRSRLGPRIGPARDPAIIEAEQELP